MRVDTAHGEVHAHFFHRTRPAEREVILVISSQNDVDTGYLRAETLLLASWSDDVSRWRGGS